MIAWWLVAGAQGANVLKTGNVCVALQPTFANAIGDHAKVSPPRPAYGLQYEITDALATYGGYLLDRTGCLDDFPVFTESEGGPLTLTVWSRARLRGIDVESWIGEDHRGEKRFAVATFTLSTGSTTTFSTTSTVVGTDQRWRNLSVAGVLFWDHDWDVPEDRPSPPIHLQSDPSVRPGSCCGARLHDHDDVLGNEPLGLTTGTDMAFRFRLTREVRRVLSGINDALWDCGKGHGSKRCRQRSRSRGNRI